MLIGLTGGIASGKSTVSNILRECGAVIVDADKIAHDLLKKGEPGWEKVKNHFGSTVLTDTGEIDRNYLGQIVFNDHKKREKLEQLTHPLILGKIKREIKKYSSENKIVILDAPLLYETNLDRLVDQVWVVYIDKNTQLERLKNRDNFSCKQAQKRIDSQMPLKKKKNMADVVIDNSGDRDYLYRQIEKLWKKVNEKIN